MISFVKALFSRNFYQKIVGVNFRNYHTMRKSIVFREISFYEINHNVNCFHEIFPIKYEIDAELAEIVFGGEVRNGSSSPKSDQGLENPFLTKPTIDQQC